MNKQEHWIEWMLAVKWMGKRWSVNESLTIIGRCRLFWEKFLLDWLYAGQAVRQALAGQIGWAWPYSCQVGFGIQAKVEQTIHLKSNANKFLKKKKRERH